MLECCYSGNLFQLDHHYPVEPQASDSNETLVDPLVQHILIEDTDLKGSADLAHIVTLSSSMPSEVSWHGDKYGSVMTQAFVKIVENDPTLLESAGRLYENLSKRVNEKCEEIERELEAQGVNQIIEQVPQFAFSYPEGMQLPLKM